MAKNSARNRDFKGCKLAIEHGADVNYFEDGDNPLHWAAFWGDRAVTQVLLAAGADRQATNKVENVCSLQCVTSIDDTVWSNRCSGCTEDGSH